MNDLVRHPTFSNKQQGIVTEEICAFLDEVGQRKTADCEGQSISEFTVAFSRQHVFLAHCVPVFCEEPTATCTLTFCASSQMFPHQCYSKNRKLFILNIHNALVVHTAQHSYCKLQLSVVESSSHNEELKYV
uniref:Bm1649, isoform b n=1 Tax=Brugia malayi TaxID=6279 RepID=A0A1I9G6E9_BRUMA|nr:Bm1649, isoform b [Brugia malayi]